MVIDGVGTSRRLAAGVKKKENYPESGNDREYEQPKKRETVVPVHHMEAGQKNAGDDRNGNHKGQVGAHFQ